MAAAAVVEFVFGLGSRYSYLASTQLGRIRQKTACELLWTPVSSVELMNLRGQSPFLGSPVSGQYDWDYRRKDAEAWAAYYGVPFTEPHPAPQDHQLMAVACRAAEALGAMVPYIHSMFRAVFDEHREIDANACIDMATRQGLDRQKFGVALADPAVRARVSQDAVASVARGVFGVPAFLVDDRVFWGNDRLVLLEHHLGTRQ
jgi:2-hydroxychromene-2-carboxylate isomerase